MQLGVGRIAVCAIGAVGFKVGQLHQQFGHVARAFAADLGRLGDKAGQRGVGPAPGWRGLWRQQGSAHRVALPRRGHRQAVQPLGQRGIGLRLAQQVHARRGQGLAHRVGREGIQHRLGHIGQGRRDGVHIGQPVFVQLGLVHQHSVQHGALQARGGLDDVVKRPQHLHRPTQTPQQRRPLQPLAQGGTDDGDPPGRAGRGRPGQPGQRRRTAELRVGGGHLLQLRHVQRREAADGVPQIHQLLDQRQAPDVVF